MTSAINNHRTMTRQFTIWIALMITLTASAITDTDVEQAQALAARLSAPLAQKVQFKIIEADGGKDVFSLESNGGKVVIGGNNAGSMAVGLNRYLNRYCHTTVSWYADVAIELPKALPGCPSGNGATGNALSTGWH